MSVLFLIPLRLYIDENIFQFVLSNMSENSLDYVENLSIKKYYVVSLMLVDSFYVTNQPYSKVTQDLGF